MSSFLFSQWLFIKLLALGYLIAFLSLLPQVGTLFGKMGILSIDNFLGALEKEEGLGKYWQVPSLFWLSSTDFVLWLSVLIGLVTSSLILFGVLSSWLFLVCWIIYLSFVATGQDFMGYQWDGFLLELGFLALFFLPWDLHWNFWAVAENHWSIQALLWFLLFKLNTSSGLAKLVSKENSWRNLTALDFHFWTQPLPNKGAFLMSLLPKRVLKTLCLLVLMVEIIVPFMIFMAEDWRLLGFALLAGFQLILFFTGNFTFFNLLTISLAITLLPDSFWLRWLPTEVMGQLTPVTMSSFQLNTLLALVFAFIPLHLFWISFSISEKFPWNRFFIPLARSLYYLRINNHYALFSTMTRERPELVIEGSNDGEHWQEYSFHYKPGLQTKELRQVAPHQPRVDWQMWFAALGHFHQNLWLQNLLVLIFWRSPEVLKLFAHNPFPGDAPQFLRIQKYAYRFSTWQQFRQEKMFWQRHWVGLYSPVFKKEDFED